MSRRRAALAFIGVALLTAGCDHAAKQAARIALGDGAAHSLAGDLVRFELTHNSGGFLSLGALLAPALREALFLVLAPLLIAALLAATLRVATLSRAVLAGLALVSGGGLANWLDRVANAGAVTDFVSLGFGPLRTGIFNLADVAIMAGAALMIFAPFRAPAEHREP